MNPSPNGSKQVSSLNGHPKKRVLISVPNTHWIHKTVVHKLLLLLQDGRYKSTIIMPSHKPFVENLHRIVQDFIKGDYDFWLSMDADNPPLNNPLDLVELDKDIIGLPTPVWHWNGEEGERPIYWNAYRKAESGQGYNEYFPREGLQEVDAIGTGCFLVARRVFEDPIMQKGAFHRTYTETGVMDKGNDIAFCERAKLRGFRVWAHFDYFCDHFSELSLNEVCRAMKGMGIT